jgi:hypothetical protein
MFKGKSYTNKQRMWRFAKNIRQYKESVLHMFDYVNSFSYTLDMAIMHMTNQKETWYLSYAWWCRFWSFINEATNQKKKSGETYISMKHAESKYLRLVSCLGLYDVMRGNIEE